MTLLRVLLIEDSVDDADLLLHALRRGGYDVQMTRVETADAMRTALQSASWDLVISDYSLPAFSGPEALQVLKETGQDLPFIIISGTIGEEVAVSALKAGAHDFLVKGRLARLLPAIERELDDVSQRRERARAEAALRQSEEKHRALVERAVFGICQATTDGRFLTVNPAFVSMLGYDAADDLRAVGLTGLYEDAGTCQAFLHRIGRDAQISGHEAFWLRKDGRKIRVRLSGRLIDVPDGSVSVLELIVEDTTQSHHLEEQLRQAQKMEAIGHLAGGIAHDFNNLLTAILGYGALVSDAVADRPDAAADMDEVLRAGQRARTLIGQLMAFSRKQVVEPQALDLNAVVDGVEKLLRHAIGKLVQLKWEPGANLPPIMADAGQIEQVLMNLSVNARDAMPTGGTLTIRTSVGSLPPHLAPAGEPPSRRYDLLSVADTGSGMPASVKQHIFEPFFTTKGPDKGTGLGLSTVYGIVTQSGGHISVDSEIGAGTTFTIYFPSVEVEIEEHAADDEESESVPATTAETILLVEDEPAIRTLAERVLKQSGYRVLVAADGATGHRMAETYPDVIHLLLSDIRMPGVSGPDLAQRLVMDRPDLKVLFISGYADDRLRLAVQRTRMAFLAKPFSREQLTSKVRACLASDTNTLNAVAS